jgi:hypothetical protein
MLLLEKKRKTERKKRGKNPKKNRYFTKIEPYLYEFVENESSFGIYTRKTKGILSSLYVCMAIKYIIVLLVETPRKFYKDILFEI